jgi:hypothetical protein
MPSSTVPRPLLAAISRIDSLHGGVVVFDAKRLAGGRWYEPDRLEAGLLHVWAPVPPIEGEGEGLKDRARSLLLDAIAARKHEIQEQAFACADDGDHDATERALALMYAP